MIMCISIMVRRTNNLVILQATSVIRFYSTMIDSLYSVAGGVRWRRPGAG